MNKFLLIARHELTKHLRRPSFLIITLAIPLVGLAVTLVVGMLNRTEAPTPTGVAAQAGRFEGRIGYVDNAGILTTTPDDFPPDLFRAYPDEAAARAAIAAGEVALFYVLPADYIQTGSVTRYAPQIQIDLADSDLFRTLVVANLLGEHDPRLLQRLDEPLSVQTTRLDAAGQPVQDRRADSDFTRSPLSFIVPYVFAMLLYMSIIFAASFMLQSVVEEKENRTIEILLTSVQPLSLLAGKVLGLGVLGLIQVLVWLAFGRLLLTLSSEQFALFASFSLPAYVWVLAVVYFLLGYLVYASLLAGVGATVTTTRESSQLTILMIMPFIIPLWFLGAIVENPNGGLATVLSIMPLTAPVTMMIRVPLTDVAAWQVGLSLLLLVGAVALCLWLAARLFRVGTLLTGKRLTPGEIMRALRAA